jgi:ABC-type phosphate transport system substrate-binding protein
MRKRKLLLAAGACLATLSLSVGPALADPATTPRNLNGTGSDTTQGVMNALSKVVAINNVPQIASWDAATASGQTFNTGKSGCSSVPRPSGSNNGIIALVNDRNAGTHCLQFARSSTDNHTSHAGDHLTYIPFATDAVSYATTETSQINRNLSVGTLAKIYNCDASIPANTFEPLLPQFGSGTRKFFLENVLHVSGGDVSTYTTDHPCVKDSLNGVPLLENTGNLLQDDKQIEPYAISSWIAQTTKNVPDAHGFTILGNVAGVASLTPNNQTVTYATTETSQINRNLSTSTLSKIYSCDPSIPANTFEPLLPQSGSATRAAFMSKLGLADSANYTSTHTCVKDSLNGNPLPENAGNLLQNDKQILPYSISTWIAQTTKSVSDAHGFTVLGNIDSKPALSLNNSANTRPVFNVLPNVLVASGPNSKAVFVGSGSLVCGNATTIQQQGFATRNDCGDTSIQSDSSTGSDTVGTGE